MSSRTIIIQMEITKEFSLERHRGVLDLALVKAITLPELRFTSYLKIMILLIRRMQLQRMKWWLQ